MISALNLTDIIITNKIYDIIINIIKYFDDIDCKLYDKGR